MIPKVGIVLAIVGVVFCAAVIVAIEGVMYDFFSKKADAILAEKRERHHPHCGGPAAGEPAAEPVVEAVVDEVIDDVETEA